MAQTFIERLRSFDWPRELVAWAVALSLAGVCVLSALVFFYAAGVSTNAACVRVVMAGSTGHSLLKSGGMCRLTPLCARDGRVSLEKKHGK